MVRSSRQAAVSALVHVVLMNDSQIHRGDEASEAAGSPPPPVRRATGASLVAVIGVAVTFVGIMVLHGVRSDVDPLRDVMSHYANGDRGPLMSVVFYAFGLSALALGVRLGTAIDRRGVTHAVPALMVLAGLGLVVAGVFEVDRPDAPGTLQETIHSNAAVAAFVMLIVAMLLFSLACRDDDRWWSLRWVSTGLALTAAASSVAAQVARSSGSSGAMQRLLAGAVLVWFLVVAGVFEVDRPDAPGTLQETIHSNAAVAAFVMLIVAMLLFSLACRDDHRWWSLRWVSTGLALTAAASSVAAQVSRSSGSSGAMQRLLAGAVLAWFLVVAVHVRRRSFAS